ncbi:MAG: translation initiation factor IF-6 [Candidatus Woesearchaeota archaeon]
MTTEKKKDHVAIMSFNNNPNIGLYAFTTDQICLVGEEVSDDQMDVLKDVLDVPVHRIRIAGTSLIGVFCAGNSSKLLVPYIIQEEEEEELRKLGITYSKISSKLTALGNIISANDHGAIVTPDFSDREIKEISEALGTTVKKGKISELNNMGSCLKVNNIGGVAHSGISTAEIRFIEDTMRIEIVDGTINMGSPYVSSGIIANSKGFVAGAQSAGPEITNADIGLGFLKD